MDEKQQTRHSKFLSFVLRHDPGSVGLQPDPEGWVPTEELLEALGKAGYAISAGDLNEIVRSSPKRRFAFSEDGRKIRASQGHSIEIELGLQPERPPERLYHGTVAAALTSIMEQGLTRQQRHHVHLSADIHTAMAVGSRRGKAVILEVDAAGMQRAGHPFFRSANGVWLTDTVPPEFLHLRDQP